MRQAAVPNRQERTADPTFARACAAAAAAVLTIGTLGTFYLRFRSGVSWRVPSVPYWYSFPFYVFPHPHPRPPLPGRAPRRPREQGGRVGLLDQVLHVARRKSSPVVNGPVLLS